MSVLLRPRWLALHLSVVAMVATCGGMSWWQFVRAEGGSGRSLGYALQWPGFGLFALCVWAWVCREAVREQRGGLPRVPAPTSAPSSRVHDDVVLPPERAVTIDTAPADDPELAAWNAMLTRMNEGTTR